jgi:hypothetical protein
MVAFMASRAQLLLGVVAALLLVLTAGCGSSASIPGNAVAVVGNTPITRGELAHWMTDLVGEDYYAHIRAKAPLGLVAEPRNVVGCVRAAQQVVPTSSTGQPSLTRAQVAGRCRELHEAIKQQALTLLISFARRDAEGVEEGIAPSKREVEEKFLHDEAVRFPKIGEFQAYIDENDTAPANELVELKEEIIANRQLAAFRKQHSSLNWPEQLEARITAGNRKWKAQTSCRSGYLVPECRQFKGPPASTVASPADILEGLAEGQLVS